VPTSEAHKQNLWTEKPNRRKSKEIGIGESDDLRDDGSRQQRLLMREWLIEQANRNDIPGLGWYDRPYNQLLRIPWIHGSKSGWSADYHCRLFELWAVYSGKISLYSGIYTLVKVSLIFYTLGCI